MVDLNEVLKAIKDRDKRIAEVTAEEDEKIKRLLAATASGDFSEFVTEPPVKLTKKDDGNVAHSAGRDQALLYIAKHPGTEISSHELAKQVGWGSILSVQACLKSFDKKGIVRKVGRDLYKIPAK